MKKLTARAQLAFCWTAMLLAAQAHAQLEGSLFTSPEERTYLDYLRAEFLRNNAEDDFNIEQTDIPEIPDATTAEPAGPVEYSFGGAMSGRDGVRVWLNGQLLGESQLPEGFSVVQSGRSFSLRIVNDGMTYVLLPGQTVDVTAGTVVESFQRAVPESAPAVVPASAVVVNEAAPDAAVAEAEEAVETSAEMPAVAAEASAVVVTAGEAPATDVAADPLSAAVDQLDDETVDDLFELLENRRLARTVNEAPE